MDRPRLSLKNKLVKLHVIVLVFLFLMKLLFFETGDGKSALLRYICVCASAFSFCSKFKSRALIQKANTQDSSSLNSCKTISPKGSIPHIHYKKAFRRGANINFSWAHLMEYRKLILPRTHINSVFFSKARHDEACK
jgi:hypothetical protein